MTGDKKRKEKENWKIKDRIIIIYRKHDCFPGKYKNINRKTITNVKRYGIGN